MDVKRKGWKVGFLCLLAMLFIASPAFVLEGQTVPKTPYPYDEVGVVMGFSGVYDVWLFEKFWIGDQATQELRDWLNRIAEGGGNIVRIFSHYNGDTTNYTKKTMSPWKRTQIGDDEFEYDINSWEDQYFVRLKEFLRMLKERGLKAWIDIWDFNSIGGQKYKTHPFWNDKNTEIPDSRSAFVENSTIKEWRRNFEIKIVDATNAFYSPIYSTNEFAGTDSDGLDIGLTKQFYDEFNEVLNVTKGVPASRISHSPPILGSYPLYEYLKGKNFLLAVHNRSEATEIDEAFIRDHGIKVISSDGEDSGKAAPRGGCWKDHQKPLSAEQVKESMIKALKLGFCGLEILDRDEYWTDTGYEDPDLLPVPPPNFAPGIDTVTLAQLRIAFEGSRIAVNKPIDGDSYKKKASMTIKWDVPSADYYWGTIAIYLYKGSTKVKAIKSGLPPNNGNGSYTWTISDDLVEGNDYRVRISRFSPSGRLTYLTEYSGNFSITKCAPPSKVVLSAPLNGAILKFNEIGPSVTFSWKVTSPASSKYQVQIYKNGTPYAAQYSTNTSLSLTAPEIFSDGNLFTWKVSGTNECGYGQWSDTWKIFTPPAKTLLINPGNGDTVYEPFITLEWSTPSSNPSVTKYHLQTWKNGIKDVDNSNIPASQTSYEVGPLGNGKPYTWQVRAHNGKEWGEWSQKWTVTYRIIY